MYHYLEHFHGECVCVFHEIAQGNGLFSYTISLQETQLITLMTEQEFELGFWSLLTTILFSFCAVMACIVTAKSDCWNSAAVISGYLVYSDRGWLDSLYISIYLFQFCTDTSLHWAQPMAVGVSFSFFIYLLSAVEEGRYC